MSTGRKGRCFLDYSMTALVVVSMLTGSACSGSAPDAANAPLVLLVSIDTLRADTLSSYGNPRGMNPSLDRLGRDSVLFTETLAPSPWTIPSHASLFTSLDPSVVEARSRVPIEPNIRTVAEMLEERGFATGAVVNTGYLDRKLGFDQGFQEYEHLVEPGDPWWKKDSPANVDEAIDFFRRQRNNPAFFFLHLFDIHAPYIHPEPYDRLCDGIGLESDGNIPYLKKIRFHRHLTQLDTTPSIAFLRARYDAGMTRVDAELGRLFAALNTEGMYDDALIVVTSDHGEAFFERRVWVGHGHFLYSSELHVPLIIKFPASFDLTGELVGVPTSLLDIVPTILYTLNLPLPDHLQGRSLLDSDYGVEIGESAVYGSSSNTGYSRFIRAGRWKYMEPMRVDPKQVVRRLRPDPSIRQEFADRIVSGAQLFDLKSDPGETRNRVKDFPGVARRFRDLLRKRLRQGRVLHGRIHGDRELVVPQLTDEERAQLEALGYLN